MDVKAVHILLDRIYALSTHGVDKKKKGFHSLIKISQ